MLASIPAFILYAVPVFLVLGYLGLRQEIILWQINRGMKIRTKVRADELTRHLLNENGIAIPVCAGKHYLRNTYDSAVDAVLLSPNTINETDYISICYAFQAAARAIYEKNNPIGTNLLQAVQAVKIVSFWIVFTIISFGLMSSTLSLTAIGYIAAIVPLSCFTYLNKIQLDRTMHLFNKSKCREQLTPKEQKDIQKLLKAVILKWNQE